MFGVKNSQFNDSHKKLRTATEIEESFQKKISEHCALRFKYIGKLKVKNDTKSRLRVLSTQL